MKRQWAQVCHRDLRRLAVNALVAVLLIVAISGCGLGEWARNGAKLGPNYEPPLVAVAENWIDYQDPRIEQNNAQDLARWWGVFNDPILNSLIDEAYAQNLSLRGA